MAESKEELKRLLMRVRRERKVKKESEYGDLKQHSKNNIMASGPITSW